MVNRYSIFIVFAFPTYALSETGKTNYAPPSTLLSTESIVQMAGGLLLVLAIIGGITWLLKRFSLIPAAAIDKLKIVAATGVGQRERVVVVEINGTWLVLGVAPGHVSSLHTMDKPTLNTADKILNDSSTEVFAAQLNERINKNHV